MPYTDYPAITDVTDILTDAGMTAPSSKTLGQKLRRAITEWERYTNWQPFLNGSSSSGTYAVGGATNILVNSSASFVVGQQAVFPSTGETQTVTALPDSTHVTVAALSNNYDGSVTPFQVQSQKTLYRSPPGPAYRGSYLALRGGGQKLEFPEGLISLNSLSVTDMAYTLGVQFWLKPDSAPARNRPYEYASFLVPVWSKEQNIAINGLWGFCTEVPDDAWDAILDRAVYLLTGTVIAAKVSQGRARYTEGEVTEVFSMTRDAGAYAYEASKFFEQYDESLKSYRRITWMT